MALVEGLRGFVPFSQISSVSSCLRTVEIVSRNLYNLIYMMCVFLQIFSESSS